MGMKVSRNIARREFLKRAAMISGTAVGLPLIVPSEALGRGNTVAPSNRINLGFVGVGDMGKGNLRNFLGREDVHVIGVCDVDRNYIADTSRLVESKQGKGCFTTTDFRELLQRPELDAIVVSTPDHWHATVAVSAASAGLDVYGEKPIGYNIAQGRAICNAITRYGRIWQTGSWQRSQAEFHRACELIRNGRVGKIHTVEIGLGEGIVDHFDRGGFTDPEPVPPELDYDMWLGPAPWAHYCRARLPKNWRWNLDYGGGRISDWVGHHGDIALWALGLEHTGPTEVEATGTFGTGLWNGPLEYKSYCKFAEGPTIVFCDKFPVGAKFIGDRGWLYVSRGVLKAEPRSILDEQIGSEETRLYVSRDHAGNFLEGIRTRRPTITPTEPAQRAATLGYLSLIAMQLGRPLRWDPRNEQFVNAPDANKLIARPQRAPWTV